MTSVRQDGEKQPSGGGHCALYEAVVIIHGLRIPDDNLEVADGMLFVSLYSWIQTCKVLVSDFFIIADLVVQLHSICTPAKEPL